MCTNSIIGQHVKFKWYKTNNIRQMNLLLHDPTYGKRMIYIYIFYMYIYKLILCEYTAIKKHILGQMMEAPVVPRSREKHKHIF